MFKIIKGYYGKKLYTKEQIAKFVIGGTITAAQYQEITGDEYVAPEVSSVIKELRTEINQNNVGIVLTGAALLSRAKDDEIRIAKLELPK